MTIDNEIFRVEHQYQLYLKRVALSELHMHPQQRVETKRAFFGAWGQLLLLMNDVADLTEDEGVVVLQEMTNQVGEYWAVKANRH